MCQTCLGSRAPRSPSPTKLNAMTVRGIAAPGAVTRCGATKRKCRPSPIIDPHDGAGGATPRPRKESPASATMARAIPKVASTRIGESALGRMCRRRRRAGELPTARADSTNSLVLTESTCARITRAYPTHPRIERAKRTFPNEGPRTAAMPMASRIPGNASRTSQAPVKIRAAAPPRKPASDPTGSPRGERAPDGAQPHGEREACPVDQPGKDVAPELVLSQPVGSGRTRQSLVELLRARVARRGHRREGGGGEEQGEPGHPGGRPPGPG